MGTNNSKTLKKRFMKLKKIGLFAGIFTALIQILETRFPSPVVLHAKQQQSARKKKILIFTCKGGYGHLATSNALKELLANDYEITIAKPLELLGKFDPVKKLSGKKMDAEQLYNYLLQSCSYHFINFTCSFFAPFLLRLSNQKKERVILDYVKEEKPDLLISVMPFVNLASSNAAHVLKIPFLLITTDGDVSQWVYGLKHMHCSDFKVTIGFETNKTRSLFQKCGIRNDNIILTGFPIRPDFFEKKNKDLIRKQWDLPADKFTVMVMMGGVGATSTLAYVRKLMKMSLPIHVIACVGKNQKMMRKLAKIKPKNVTLSLIPFTDRISDLMAVSDLLITKPGPGSINEALHMRLPMLIDATATPVFWEKENIRFVQDQEWGEVVSSLSNLEEIISRYLFDKKYVSDIKKSLQTFNVPHFSMTIRNIITSMCPPTQV